MQSGKSKSWFKRLDRIGPGGWNCSCCAPPPGVGKWRALKRFKHEEQRTAQREENRLAKLAADDSD